MIRTIRAVVLLVALAAPPGLAGEGGAPRFPGTATVEVGGRAQEIPILCRVAGDPAAGFVTDRERASGTSLTLSAYPQASGALAVMLSDGTRYFRSDLGSAAVTAGVLAATTTGRLLVGEASVDFTFRADCSGPSQTGASGES